MNPLQGAQLERAVAWEPILGARIHSWYRCYGNGYPFCDFWMLYADNSRAEEGEEQVQPLGALCRYQGTLTISCSLQVDFAELAAFLPATGALEVEAMEPILQELLPYLEHGSLHRGLVMTIPPKTWETMELPAAAVQVQQQVNYADVHALLCTCFEGFEEQVPFSPWYVDTSAHVRRSDCLVVSVEGEGGVISTAGVYYVGPQMAMIADVGTHPAHRGRGLAGACLRACMQHIRRLGRRPCLVLARPELEPFYAAMGFVPHSVRCAVRLGEAQDH